MEKPLNFVWWVIWKREKRMWFRR